MRRKLLVLFLCHLSSSDLKAAVLLLENVPGEDTLSIVRGLAWHQFWRMGRRGSHGGPQCSCVCTLACEKGDAPPAALNSLSGETGFSPSFFFGKYSGQKQSASPVEAEGNLKAGKGAVGLERDQRRLKLTFVGEGTFRKGIWILAKRGSDLDAGIA